MTWQDDIINTTIDLYRTEEALAAHDEARALGEDTEEMAVAVGHAFALDSAEINCYDTAALVRPGRLLPAGHPDEPWVRRLVRKWQEGQSALGITHRICWRCANGYPASTVEAYRFTERGLPPHGPLVEVGGSGLCDICTFCDICT